MKRFHYAWIVLLLSFFALLSAQGVRLSFGAFIQPWEQEFSADRAAVSLIALVSYLVYAVSGPVVGKVVDQYGVRKVLSASILIVGVSTLISFMVTSTWQLIILYGVISSIGFGGASNVVTSVMITQWFYAKRGLALGLMAAGSGAGQFLIVPASLFMIDEWGWKITVVTWGVFLCLVVLPLVLWFIRTSPADLGMKAYGEEEDKEENIEAKEKPPEMEKEQLPFSVMIRSRAFWFIAFPFFVCGVSTTGLMDTHLIPYAQMCGFATGATSLAVSLLAGFNILGTALSGHFADRWNHRYMLGYIYIIRALTVVLLIYSQDVFLLLVFSVLFGLVDFATVAPTMMLVSEQFKRYSAGVVFGWVYFSHQLGSAVGAYVPGVIYRLQGGYNTVFWFTAGLLVVASILSFTLSKGEDIRQDGSLQEAI
ncbi:MFS transporter [Ammoniphilus sp. 3BR4]|uniref:MFS transporter n=1 Tax=Ammoniphilus sp. 3BR4 TaxID=3158265 RepID=UPI003467DED4